MAYVVEMSKLLKPEAVQNENTTSRTTQKEATITDIATKKIQDAQDTRKRKPLGDVTNQRVIHHQDGSSNGSKVAEAIFNPPKKTNIFNIASSEGKKGSGLEWKLPGGVNQLQQYINGIKETKDPEQATLAIQKALEQLDANKMEWSQRTDLLKNNLSQLANSKDPGLASVANKALSELANSSEPNIEALKNYLKGVEGGETILQQVDKLPSLRQKASPAQTASLLENAISTLSKSIELCDSQVRHYLGQIEQNNKDASTLRQLRGKIRANTAEELDTAKDPSLDTLIKFAKKHGVSLPEGTIWNKKQQEALVENIDKQIESYMQVNETMNFRMTMAYNAYKMFWELLSDFAKMIEKIISHINSNTRR